MENVIQFDIGRYRLNCPACGSKRKRVEHVNYNQYREKADQLFGETSMPLCYHCWSEHYEGCDVCFMPLSSVYTSAIGEALLRKTTLVRGYDTHTCVSCIV